MNINLSYNIIYNKLNSIINNKSAKLTISLQKYDTLILINKLSDKKNNELVDNEFYKYFYEIKNLFKIDYEKFVINSISEKLDNDICDILKKNKYKLIINKELGNEYLINMLKMKQINMSKNTLMFVLKNKDKSIIGNTINFNIPLKYEKIISDSFQNKPQKFMIYNGYICYTKLGSSTYIEIPITKKYMFGIQLSTELSLDKKAYKIYKAIISLPIIRKERIQVIENKNYNIIVTSRINIIPNKQTKNYDNEPVELSIKLNNPFYYYIRDRDNNCYIISGKYNG